MESEKDKVKEKEKCLEATISNAINDYYHWQGEFYFQMMIIIIIIKPTTGYMVG